MIISSEKFTTKSGLTGVVKNIGIDYPDEQMKQRFKKLGVNTDWFCGYIIIPKTNPLYAKIDSAKNVDDIVIDVHGGVTYYEPVDKFDEDIKIDGIVIGFDCNHAGDITEIQNREYTIAEIERIAQQLMQLEEVPA